MHLVNRKKKNQKTYHIKTTIMNLATRLNWQFIIKKKKENQEKYWLIKKCSLSSFPQNLHSNELWIVNCAINNCGYFQLCYDYCCLYELMRHDLIGFFFFFFISQNVTKYFKSHRLTFDFYPSNHWLITCHAISVMNQTSFKQAIKPHQYYRLTLSFVRFSMK